MGGPQSELAGNAQEPGKLSLTATLLSGAGTLLLVVGGVTLANELDTRRWPAVAGRLLVSEVTSETSRQVHAASGRGVTQTHYTATIAYEYTVDGTEFVGTRVSTADVDHPVEDETAAIVTQYPAGTQTDVYYDPDDASMAVLDNDMAGSGYRIMGLGGLLVVVSVGMKIDSRFLPPLA